MSSPRNCAGRLFQTRDLAAAKLFSSNVLCVRGTAHDLSVDEHSQRLGPSETKFMSSAKYGGAWPASCIVSSKTILRLKGSSRLTGVQETARTK